MDSTEIKQLINRRTNLQLKIREYVLKNKNAYDHVIEYADLTEQLLKQGKNVSIRAEYLQLKNWSPSGYHGQPIQSGQPECTQQVVPQAIPNIPQEVDNEFILNLAWVEHTSQAPDQVSKIVEFLDNVGLKLIDKNTNTINNKTEKILKYKFEGDEKSFRLLKMCTQFVLDLFSLSEADSFNIAIYGKKIGK